MRRSYIGRKWSDRCVYMRIQVIRWRKLFFDGNLRQSHFMGGGGGEKKPSNTTSRSSKAGKSDPVTIFHNTFEKLRQLEHRKETGNSSLEVLLIGIQKTKANGCKRERKERHQGHRGKCLPSINN